MNHSLRTVAMAAALCLCATPFGASAETFAFSSRATGPFVVTPVSLSVLQEDQQVTFDYALPFQLTSGIFQAFVNLAVPAFPERLFGSSFTLYGLNGDALFGTYTVDTSIFSDPVNPLVGDFTGSEDFTGHFTFTGGAGRYAGATGGGTYIGHSDYLANNPFALFSGESTLISTGTVTAVPEPSEALLILAGLAMLLATRRRQIAARQT